MSPASSGALEIERYIGACLITNQNQGRHKAKIGNQYESTRYHHHQQHPHQRCGTNDVWAGGMPLISYPGRWMQEEVRNPLARLAVHTQGAPLILANRYGYRKNRQPKNLSRNFDPSASKKDKDTVSIASDESSNSSVNSENCLPRIIKPRKRRKKDRKPPPHLLHPSVHVHQEDFSTDSASPDVDSPIIAPRFMPYFTFGYEPTFEFKEEVPKLHHSFDELEDFDLNGNQTESSCQCKYCDPDGQIWDIDTSCYSPFLTSPSRPLSYPESKSTSSITSSILDSLSSLSLDDMKSSTSSTPRSMRDLEVSTEIVTSMNGHRDLEIKFFSMEKANSDKTNEFL